MSKDEDYKGRIVNVGTRGHIDHGVSASFSNELLCCSDVEFLRKTVDSLWQIIDDIDTMSDIAKSDDKFYRARVEKYQARRWKLGIVCDGYKLIVKET